MSGELLMSKKERRRIRVLERVKMGMMTLKEAGPLMGVSYRQAIRIKNRYEQQGSPGLVHRSRGRGSNRKADPAIKEAILKRYEKRYAGFGPTFAMEKLQVEGYEIHHETLRRWLPETGLWQRHRASIVNAGSRSNGLGRWCSWTAAITAGSRSGAAHAA